MTLAGTRRRYAATLLVCALSACLSGTALAAKPGPNAFADVQVTFGGQTFGFAGVLDTFSQSQNGGRIAFELTMLGTPGYVPLPQIDTSSLKADGNYWEVVSKLGNRSDVFAGTCASETYSSSEGGATVRHLYLNCSSLSIP